MQRSNLNGFENIALAVSLLGAICGTAFNQPALATVPMVATMGLQRIKRQGESAEAQVLVKRIASDYLTPAQLDPVRQQLGQLQSGLKTLESGPILELQTQLGALQAEQAKTIAALAEAPLPSGLRSPMQRDQDASQARKPHQRVVLIDGANLYHTSRQLNVRIDYARLMAKLKGEVADCRFIFYTGEAKSSPAQQGFFNWLKYQGVELVRKPVTYFADGNSKSNLDVEIGLDMYTLARTYKEIVLVSGDGDLACSIRAAQNLGALVEVACFRPCTSKVLIQVADQYLDLAEMVDQIGMECSAGKVG